MCFTPAALRRLFHSLKVSAVHQKGGLRSCLDSSWCFHSPDRLCWGQGRARSCVRTFLGFLSRGADFMAIISRNLWCSLLQVLGQLLVPKQQKKRGMGKKRPKKIPVLKNLYQGFCSYSKASKEGESLKAYRQRSKYGKICALPCHRLIKEGTYFKSIDNALARMNGRSLVLEGNQPFVKSAYFFS